MSERDGTLHRKYQGVWLCQRCGRTSWPAPIRRAIVTDDRTTLETVGRYLPSNYEARKVESVITIEGRDLAGWTLDGYVIPRLASGLIPAMEVD